MALLPPAKTIQKNPCDYKGHTHTFLYTCSTRASWGVEGWKLHMALGTWMKPYVTTSRSTFVLGIAAGHVTP